MADRHADRGGDAADFCRGGAPLQHRRLDQPVEVGRRARRARGALGPQGHLPVARLARPVVGAGTLHLHVHLDGEVRRRLWRTDRHPCRRGRVRQYAAAGLPQAGDRIQPAMRRAVHRHRRGLRRRVCARDVRDWAAVQRSRSADVACLYDVAARLRPDVLSLPAGRLVVLLDRSVAAPRRRTRRRHRRRSGAASLRRREQRRGRTRNQRTRAHPHPGAAPHCGDLRGPRYRPDHASARDARRDRIHSVGRTDADRHASVDFARADRAGLHVYADRRAHGIGRAQAFHRAGKLRDHGDPVLHPGGRGFLRMAVSRAA